MSDEGRAHRIRLLGSESQHLLKAAQRLRWSLDRASSLLALPAWNDEQLERLESMASRFARLSDLLTQRLMRLADELELESPGSLLDRIRRAEKRGWVDADGQLVRSRELRNLIAHEYEDEDLPALYREVAAMSAVLLQAAERAAGWAEATMQAADQAPG